MILRRLVAGAALAAWLSGCSHLVVLHDPLSAAEHNDLGVAYESRHQTTLAEREYRSALRADRHFAVARVNLGNLAAQSGRWKRAEACYRMALRDRAGDPDAMNNLAVVLLKQGRDLGEAESRGAPGGGGERRGFRVSGDARRSAPGSPVRRSQTPRATR